MYSREQQAFAYQNMGTRVLLRRRGLAEGFLRNLLRPGQNVLQPDMTLAAPSRTTCVEEIG